MERSLTVVLACAALFAGIAATHAMPQRSYGSSAADLSREINGVPCGMNCTARHHYRWAHHYYGRHPGWNAYYPPRR
jgi:hypothetical protein